MNFSEAATGSVSWKKLFLKILQYSQESCRSATLLKTDFNTDVFLLKSGSHFPKKVALFAWLKASLKMMKNVFYFVWKASFVLKIFKVLARRFGHVGKTAWLTSKFMTSQPGVQTIRIHILPNISKSKGNQTIKPDKLIEHNKRNIFC